jgi:hypothetical protein
VSWSIAQIVAIEPPAPVSGTVWVAIAKLAISSPPFFISGIGLRFDPTTGSFTLKFPAADRFRRCLVHDKSVLQEMIAAARAELSALKGQSVATPPAKATSRETYDGNARAAATP